MENDYLSIIIEGAKRIIGKPQSRQKEPMSTEMVKQVMDRFGRSDNLILPVSALSEKLRITGLNKNGGNHPISRLARTKTGHNAHGNKPLTDTSVRAFLTGK